MNASIASWMVYALQNAPTMPDFSLGSSCLEAVEATTLTWRVDMGQVDASCQSVYPSRIESGSSGSPSNVRHSYSPSTGVDGQYMSRCGS